MDEYQKWLRYYVFKDADDLVEPYLRIGRQREWISRARTALHLSQHEMARRLHISATTFRELEIKEHTVSLVRLEKCAQAMGCELVYAIRPRSQNKFSEEIWNLLLANLKEKKDDFAVHAKALMFKPEFRRKQGWCKNWQPEAEEDKWFWKRANATYNVVKKV